MVKDGLKDHLTDFEILDAFLLIILMVPIVGYVIFGFIVATFVAYYGLLKPIKIIAEKIRNSNSRRKKKTTEQCIMRKTT